MVALSEHVAGEGGTVAFDVAQIDVRHEPHRVVVVVPFNGDGNVAAAVGGVGFLDFAVGEAAGELRAPVVGVDRRLRRGNGGRRRVVRSGVFLRRGGRFLRRRGRDRRMRHDDHVVHGIRLLTHMMEIGKNHQTDGDQKQIKRRQLHDARQPKRL